MNISQAFKAANDFLSDDNLVPITALKDKDHKESIEKKWNAKFPEFSYIQKGIDFLGKDEKYFYASSNQLRPFYYKKDQVLVEIPGWDEDFLDSFEVKRRIEVNEEEYQKCIDNKDFDRLFYLIINESIRFSAFKELFEIIPDEMKYELFINIYTTSEYGFRELDIEFVKKVFTYRSKEVINKKNSKLLPYTDEKGFIKIYRGIGKESTPIKDSFSWTINFYTSVFFAARFDLEGDVYSAKVHIDDVIDFLEDRNEGEIIAQYSSLNEVSSMKMYNLNDIVNDLTFSGDLDEYHELVTEIKDDFFKDPKGIHGVLHTKRVLMMTIILCMLEDVVRDDFKILTKAALFHDIGRIHDNEDEDHGKLSIEKMKKLKIFRNNKNDKDQILKYIIENHCINDELAFNNVFQYNIEDTGRAVYLLKLFKDADGLDRVRLGDLDVKYLRNKDAKKLAVIAFLLKDNIR